jgi:hypothetical protein
MNNVVSITYISSTGYIKVIGAFFTAIAAFKTHAEVSFPHGSKQRVFKFCAHAQSLSPLLSWSVT